MAIVRLQKFMNIECDSVFQHKENRDGNAMSEPCHGGCFSVTLGCAIVPFAYGLTFTQHGCRGFGKCPFEGWVSDFIGAAASKRFAGGFTLRIDYPTIGAVALGSRESIDSVCLVKYCQSQDFTDAWRGAKQRVIGVTVMGCIGSNLLIKILNDHIYIINIIEIGFERKSDIGVWHLLNELAACGFSLHLGAQRISHSPLAECILYMRKRARAASDEEMAAAEQVARRAHIRRIHVGNWKAVGSEHIGNTASVYFIVFVLFAALLSDIQSVSKKDWYI
jgi:hypothetical protein